MRWSGVSKSSTREVGDDAADLVEAGRVGPERGGPVVADAAHGVDLRTNTVGEWLGTQYDVVSLIVLPGAPR